MTRNFSELSKLIVIVFSVVCTHCCGMSCILENCGEGRSM